MCAKHNRVNPFNADGTIKVFGRRGHITGGDTYRLDQIEERRRRGEERRANAEYNRSLREQAKAARLSQRIEKQHTKMAKQREKAERAEERRSEIQGRREHVESLRRAVAKKNAEIASELNRLAELLPRLLSAPCPLGQLLHTEARQPFNPRLVAVGFEEGPKLEAYVDKVPPKSWSEWLFGGNRYEQEVSQATAEFNAALSAYNARRAQAREAARSAACRQHEEAEDVRVGSVRASNERWRSLFLSARNGDAGALRAILKEIGEGPTWGLRFLPEEVHFQEAPPRVCCSLRFEESELAPECSKYSISRETGSVVGKPVAEKSRRKICRDAIREFLVGFSAAVLNSLVSAHILEVYFTGHGDSVDVSGGVSRASLLAMNSDPALLRANLKQFFAPSRQ